VGVRLISSGVLAVSLLVAGCIGPADDNADTADQAIAADHGRWLDFVARHGLRPRGDRGLVIGVRGRDLAGNVHPTRVTNAFDDTLVIMTPNRDLVRLAASTHPFEVTATSEDGVPDVDGDTKPDVGMIRPGVYLATRREERLNIGGSPSYQVTTSDGADKLPGYRNTNQDAQYTPAELASSQTRSDTLTAVLFHQASEGTPRAVGCQVLDAESMRRLVEKAGASFDYLLVDANETAVP
jgi:hypothetical protein